jgi:hypothetical protein
MRALLGGLPTWVFSLFLAPPPPLIEFVTRGDQQTRLE